ncbi:MAG: HDOD domain-containing protein [Calditrichia bacterium]|nr:HDOD domain-containing protein [Calditrichia bacterium]
MRKVLFVDDEPNVVLGLKRMLRPFRNEWDMKFALSGEEALQILEKEKYDVVVSDMRMPKMDGAQLLKEVMIKYPYIVRIILSGHSEQELVLKSIRPTHQFLSKPCTAEKLKNTVQRACELHDILFNEDVKKVLSSIDTLPSLPALYKQIMEKLQDPDSSIKDIADIIKKDVGMTAQILKIVNSSFFGFFNQVSDPVQAVSLLGLNTVKTLVLSIEIFASFKTDKEIKFSFNDLWEHSSLTGILARTIAKDITDEKHKIEDAFMAGFLHDIGILVLVSKLPEEYTRILQIAQNENITLWDAEYNVLSSSHTEVGAYLLGLWGFGDNIVEAIARHHIPVPQPDSPLSLVTIVHVADFLAREFKNPNKDITFAQLEEKYINDLNLKENYERWYQLCKEQFESGESK